VVDLRYSEDETGPLDEFELSEDATDEEFDVPSFLK
jgi:hypothetical protein